MKSPRRLPFTTITPTASNPNRISFNPPLILIPKNKRNLETVVKCNIICTLFVIILLVKLTVRQSSYLHYETILTGKELAKRSSALQANWKPHIYTEKSRYERQEEVRTNMEEEGNLQVDCVALGVGDDRQLVPPDSVELPTS